MKRMEGESLRQGSLPPRGGHNSGFFPKTALSPALYYGIMAISCRKTSGAVGKNRFVWQPAMRKEFMYEEQ